MSENQTVLATAQKQSTEVIPGFYSSASFESLQRIARAFAYSHYVPDNFKGDAGLPSCMIAVDIALRANAAPLLVLQNLILVHGKPSWSAKYLIATANTCGRFSAIRFEYFGEPNTDGWGCRAVATELATGEKLIGPDITISLAKAEGWYGKNGSKWKTMPQKMLMWRAGAWWVDLYAPEIAMGFRTEDEERDIIDINQNGEVTNITSSNEQTAAGLRRPRRNVTQPANTEPEPAQNIVNGVDQATGEVVDDNADFEINPAAQSAAQENFDV
ncbi:MAG: hypothetical protein EKK54_07995 [Neisseriaceae bacterium]|nr:MAG: hypothetical protein EKK54_07995 [Neisseriaceae bacterium]